MDLNALVNLVPQIALAVLFAWFTERRETQAQAERRLRDTEWREFLTTTNELTTKALDNIADKLETHDARLSGVEHVVTAYSTKFDEAISAMRAAVGTRKSDTGPLAK